MVDRAGDRKECHVVQSTPIPDTVCTAPRMKSARQQAEEKRQAKLEQVREQVSDGSLVIRQMTDEERLRYPPRPAPAKRPRRW